MSTCGVCGQRLLLGMGHACSNVGPSRVTPHQTRIPAAKTWRQIERIVAADRLALHRTDDCVTVLTVDVFRSPLVSITTENLPSEECDRVVRRSLEAALDELRRIR